MNRLPPAARRALALDASSSRGSDAIVKWSLRTLANINHWDSKDDIQAKNKINQTEGAAAGGSSGVSREAASTLLKDVKLRLAGQHDRCHQLLEEAQSIFHLEEKDDDKRDNNSSLSNTDMTGNGRKRPRVIRAVHSNWSTNARHASKQSELASQLSSDAISSLSNLEAMHADTYRLVYDILSSSSTEEQADQGNNDNSGIIPLPTLLKRFSSADQSLIKSVFEQIRSRHAQTVESMADVVIALRRRRRLLGKYDPSGQKACGLDRVLIDSFLRNRLGVQLLCDHYVALARGKHYGGVAVDCDLMDVLEDAVLEACHVCDANLGVAPEVYISAHLPLEKYSADSSNDDEDLLSSITVDDHHDFDHSVPSPVDFETGGKYEMEVPEGQTVNITLVRPWVHHALVEVLKNAAASSVRKMQQQIPNHGSVGNETATLHLPPVHVRVIDEPTQVRICVIDRGVGLSDDARHKAFLFAESASAKRWDRLEEQQSYAMVRQPLGSLGVGLPLSRMMMQMFGGDVMLSNNCDYSRENDDDTVENHMNLGGCTTVVKLIKDDTMEERLGNMIPVHDDCYNHEYDVGRGLAERKEDIIQNSVM